MHRQLEYLEAHRGVEELWARVGDSYRVCWPPVADGVQSVKQQRTVWVDSHRWYATLHDAIQQCAGNRSPLM